MPPDEQVVGLREGFEVHLENFSGPFDLLLGLITRHKLDITEVALAQVTDEFISAVRAAEASDQPWELGRISEFLVVAATLLDLKAARLLPGELDTTEDLELLEARDLLFARLLQYRAFKDVAAHLGQRLSAQAKQVPRQVGLEPHLAALLPELVLAMGPAELSALAARALTPKAAPVVSLDHLHVAPVSVREQASRVVHRLRRSGAATFRSLVQDAAGTPVVVATFLALLELFREGVVGFEQVDPLGELTVRWTGAEAGDVELHDDYDEPAGAEPGAAVAAAPPDAAADVPSDAAREEDA